MSLPRLPLVLGIAALLGTVVGCAEAPIVPAAAAPHPIVGFGIDRDMARPSRSESRFESRFDRPSRFEFTPRFDTMMWIARRHH
jgi:hypothetical protein